MFACNAYAFRGPQQTGVPGAPGAADLEAALRRLTPAEVIARRACLSTGAGYSYDYDAGANSPTAFVPLGCRTPDSIMSTGSSGNLSGYGGNAWRIPEKLQIVKPIEGSQTLHHWSQLATPTLSNYFYKFIQYKLYNFHSSSFRQGYTKNYVKSFFVLQVAF